MLKSNSKIHLCITYRDALSNAFLIKYASDSSLSSFHFYSLKLSHLISNFLLSTFNQSKRSTSNSNLAKNLFLYKKNISLYFFKNWALGCVIDSLDRFINWAMCLICILHEQCVLSMLYFNSFVPFSCFS